MLGGKQIRIAALLVLDTIFFLLEIIIGYMSHSLALIADSFHMLNDIFSLLVALWAVKVAKERDPDAKYTYGWKRAEILGALVNAVFLIALCFSIFIEALQRLIQPQEITNPKLVMYIGITGLLSNCIGLVLFSEHDHSHSHSHSHFDIPSKTQSTSHSHHYQSEDLESTAVDDSGDEHSHFHSVNGSVDTFAVTDRTLQMLSSEHTPLMTNNHPTVNKQKKQRSLNMHGVFLHVLGDALGNIGVIIAALFIWKTDYSWRYYSDPVVSLLITGIIFASALPLSRKASRILLQATPKSVSAEIIRQRIEEIPGVVEVHDFHIWNLTESITIASIHVKLDLPAENYIETAKLIRNLFHEHGIHSATVQPEFVSGNVNETTRRRFSIIAGDVNGSSISLGPEDNTTARDNSNQKSSGKDSTYGSTSVGHCVIDNAVNCSQENCVDA